jgi:hypothetical protein
MENKLSNINVNLEGATETVALIILGAIAMTAMFALGIGGKEIALSIGSSIGGYLAKSVIDITKNTEKNPEKK